MQLNDSEVKVTVRKLTPLEGYHLKNIKTGDIYDGTIYLGTYDSAENYEEVSEEVYKAYLKEQEDGAKDRS